MKDRIILGQGTQTGSGRYKNENFMQERKVR
jgi:hypothetical protein